MSKILSHLLLLSTFSMLLLLGSCTIEPLSPEDKKLKTAQKIRKNGATFPAYELPNEKDELVSSKSFESGYVFYMFWGIYCASCIDNIVAVRELNRKGLIENVQFVSVSADDEAEKWKKFIYQYDMADYMTNILMESNADHVLGNFKFEKMSRPGLKDFGYVYINPAYVLVKDGVIIDNNPIQPKKGDQFLAQFEK